MNTQQKAGLGTAAILTFTLLGCGGGGSSSGGGGTRSTPVQVDIAWAARSRVVNAPASALSALITVKGGNPNGGDFTFGVDRDSTPAAYTKTYTSPSPALVGTYNVQVQFFGAAGQQGSVVGTAAKQATINSDGTGIGDITTANAVASTVVVLPNQTLTVGQTVALGFTAADSSDATIAVSPGSAFFTVTSGPDKLQVTPDGSAKGLAFGDAAVTVTVDGKTSAPQTIHVAPTLTALGLPTVSSQILGGATTLSTKLAQVTTIPTAANMALAAGSLGSGNAYAASLNGWFSSLSSGSPTFNAANGSYTWSQTANGVTISLVVSGNGTNENWALHVNGGGFNNVDYAKGTLGPATQNSKSGTAENITFTDPSGSGATLGTLNAFAANDGTASLAEQFGTSAYTLALNSDASWTSTITDSSSGTPKPVSDITLKPDGTGTGHSYCGSDGKAESDTAFSSFGGTGTVTEHATNCGGTEGKTATF